MPRSVNHVASRNRRKKILSLTRGNFGGRANVWTVAKNTWEKGLQYAYRDRKNKKLLGFITQGRFFCEPISRVGEIRTHDLLLPKQAF